MAQNERESVGGSGGDVIDQQVEIARRSLNYPGRFGNNQPTERNADRFAEVDRTNGGLQR
jgi:hypothetical protein